MKKLEKRKKQKEDKNYLFLDLVNSYDKQLIRLL